MRIFTYGCLVLFIWACSTLVTLAQKGQKAAGPLGECGTVSPSKEAIDAAEQAIFDLKKKLGNKALPGPVSLPIKVHIVRQTNGSGGATVTALNAALTLLNAKYQPVDIQFTQCGPIHYIDNDNFFACDLNLDQPSLVLNNVNDAINLYVTGTLVADGSGLNGVAYFPSGAASSNQMILSTAALSNGETLAHEMGHYLNLYHTHETAKGKELVTRGSGANCTTAGDLVCDTPADPCCYFYNVSTCTYTGTAVDTQANSYTPLVSNIMSYYGGCRTQFTPGQYSRIADGYLYRTSLMQTSGAYVYNTACPVVAAPTNLSAQEGTCSVRLNWTDNSTNENGFIVERSLSPSSGFIAVGTVTSNVTSFTDTSPVAGMATYYRVVAANSSGTVGNTVSVTVAPNNICYCVPGVTNCTLGDDIINFALRSESATLLNQASGCGTNGYSDYSSVSSATLTPGQSYTIAVTNRAQYPEGFAVWIDFNGDKTFADSERVFTSATHSRTAVQTATFTLSLSALAGTTRLRVRQSDDSSPVPTLSCNSYVYGETEDYTVVILPSTATSVASGAWTNSGIWSSGQVPTAAVDVTINAGHTVTVDTPAANVKRLQLNGKLLYQTNSKLRVGQ
ncbi:hypothetical protein F5984_02130 [Rudanella paleaurantiibacter]|uniref:Fibronectin type-III domain-containing protein n=1 Tax=Rudanella paleaurantiibacter TaxID=2614655 RepID=A0A7J5U533_9BACT|nr:GEVED domain-containing protein [Rudanella paleaurantiibacter]KAB7732771.1 hypothetical protein F5984_02130 [Rudanella paleaurantiibacter]